MLLLFRLSLIACLSGAAAQFACAQGSCKALEPMKTLVLKKMYSDAKFSIEDKANEAENARTRAPVVAFFQAMEHALDSPNGRPANPESDCAFENFGRWAQAGALTFEPQAYEGQGKVVRGLLNPGFQMIGIKFRAAGYVLNDEMLAWLQKMNRENVAFNTNPTKGTSPGNNQRVWAAAGAALNCLLERDPVALRFQDEVWKAEIAAIGGNGFIVAELNRGQQALVYHLYSFSATLVHEAARKALGYREEEADQQRIMVLANAIGHSLCDPSEMAKLAQARIRIPDGEWAYEVINAFGTSRMNEE